jgi:hypothetical protein
MSSVNDSPNHLMMLDAISRGGKSVGKIAKVTRLDRALVEMVVNGLVSQRGCRMEGLFRRQEGEKQ